MIDTRGLITVAEAAKRLDRSIEHVRRKLREGKIKGPLACCTSLWLN